MHRHPKVSLLNRNRTVPAVDGDVHILAVSRRDMVTDGSRYGSPVTRGIAAAADYGPVVLRVAAPHFRRQVPDRQAAASAVGYVRLGTVQQQVGVHGDLARLHDEGHGIAAPPERVRDSLA